MEADYEILIKSFIETNVGISNHFLDDLLAAHLKKNLVSLYDHNQMLPAGTGNAGKLTHNTSTRSDVIYWLDRNHDNAHENDFLNLIEDFIRHLNASCYAGISGYEFHYSLYETGSFYEKHRDQFHDNPTRKYSMISYLNSDWKKEDGGELLIQQGTSSQSISPMQGKTVFFKSNDLIHEVLPTQQRRMSVTGWLKG